MGFTNIRISYLNSRDLFLGASGDRFVVLPDPRVLPSENDTLRDQRRFGCKFEIKNWRLRGTHPEGCLLEV